MRLFTALLVLQHLAQGVGALSITKQQHLAQGAGPLTITNTVTSHAVLQAGVPLSSVWGTAAPGAVVQVTLTLPGGPAIPAATADATGLWRAAIPALPISSAPFNLTAASPGSASVTLLDLLAGQMVLCSGQSNMQLSIQMALNATAEIAALDAYGPTVRIQVLGGASSAPQQDVNPAPWERISAASAGQDSWAGFSATCWYTGRALWASLGSGAVPVGLVEASVGGTSIRQWSSAQALAQCSQPYTCNAYGTKPYQHSTLYNAMVAPLGTGPTTLSGIVWDQSESDSFPQTPTEFYSCAGPALIASWRSLLTAPALPFALVHLQPYQALQLELLRAAQLVATALPATAAASAMDLPDPTSPYGMVHFQDKQTIGARLALALGALWGQAPAAALHPPPAFLSQAVFFTNATQPGANCTHTVRIAFYRPGLGGGMGGASPPLTLQGAPQPYPPALGNGVGLEVLVASGVSDSPAYPLPASSVSLTEDGRGLVLQAQGSCSVYAIGSRNSWDALPLPRLYGPGGLPVLPWSQALVIQGGDFPPPPPQQL